MFFVWTVTKQMVAFGMEPASEEAASRRNQELADRVMFTKVLEENGLRAEAEFKMSQLLSLRPGSRQLLLLHF